MKIIVLRMGLPFSVILLAAATFVVAGAKGKMLQLLYREPRSIQRTGPPP